MFYENYLIEDYGLPHINWEKVFADIKEGKAENTTPFYTKLIKEWLTYFNNEFDLEYFINETEKFIYFSYHEGDAANRRLAVLEKTLKDLTATLGNLIPEEVKGKGLVIDCHDDDLYYDYISHFYPPVEEQTEYPMSGGILCSHGYSNIVISHWGRKHFNTIIAHEMTHMMLQFYRIPTWLQEGFATNAESIWGATNHYSLTAIGSLEEHEEYWNKETIKNFWTGESYKLIEASRLSYQLSYHIVNQIISMKKVNLESFIKAFNTQEDIEKIFSTFFNKKPFDFLPPFLQAIIL